MKIKKLNNFDDLFLNRDKGVISLSLSSFFFYVVRIIFLRIVIVIVKFKLIDLRYFNEYL